MRGKTTGTAINVEKCYQNDIRDRFRDQDELRIIKINKFPQEGWQLLLDI